MLLPLSIYDCADKGTNTLTCCSPRLSELIWLNWRNLFQAAITWLERSKEKKYNKPAKRDSTFEVSRRRAVAGDRKWSWFTSHCSLKCKRKCGLGMQNSSNRFLGGCYPTYVAWLVHFFFPLHTNMRTHYCWGLGKFPRSLRCRTARGCVSHTNSHLHWPCCREQRGYGYTLHVSWGTMEHLWGKLRHKPHELLFLGILKKKKKKLPWRYLQDYTFWTLTHLCFSFCNAGSFLLLWHIPNNLGKKKKDKERLSLFYLLSTLTPTHWLTVLPKQCT